MIYQGQWPLGRVIDVKFGHNGHMRSCVIKACTSQITRPVTRFCLLESINLRNMNHSGVISNYNLMKFEIFHGGDCKNCCQS